MRVLKTNLHNFHKNLHA